MYVVSCPDVHKTRLSVHTIYLMNSSAGTPRLLRCDCGTENTTLAFIHPFLRRHGSDCFAGEYSFRYGKSVTNQVQSMFVSDYIVGNIY